MSKPKVFGVTGGIGSGKSTICRVFQVLGIPVYNSDKRAKILMNEDEELHAQLVETFGDKVMKDGVLNRDFLAEHVFNNENKLHKLNALVHPAVGKDFEKWVKKHKKTAYVVKEAALLVETGIYKSLDKLIVVVAEKEERIRRVLKRDPFRTREEVLRIIANQSSDSEKTKLADFVIENNNKKRVLPELLKIHKMMMPVTT